MADTRSTTTREAVLATAKQMLADGLVEGTSGNISGRLPGGLVCLTPSSVPYDTMTLDDLVVVDLDGTVVEGTRSPTTEKDLHLGALRPLPGAGRGDPHPRRLRHDVRPRPRADPGGDRGGRRVPRRRRALLRRTRAPGPPSWATRWPPAWPTGARRCSPTTASSPAGRRPSKALHNAALGRAHGQDRVGRPGHGGDDPPAAREGQHRHGRRLPLPPGQPVTARCPSVAVWRGDRGRRPVPEAMVVGRPLSPRERGTTGIASPDDGGAA